MNIRDNRRIPPIFETNQRYDSSFSWLRRKGDGLSRWNLPPLVTTPREPQLYSPPEYADWLSQAHFDPDPLATQAEEYRDYTNHLAYVGVTEDLVDWLPTYHEGRLRCAIDSLDKFRYFQYPYNSFEWDRTHPYANHVAQLGCSRIYIFTIFAALLGNPSRAHFFVVYSSPHIHDLPARFGVPTTNVPRDPVRWFLVDATITFTSSQDLAILLGDFSAEEIQDLIVPYSLGLEPFGRNQPASRDSLLTSPLVRNLFRPRFVEIARVRPSHVRPWSESLIEFFGPQREEPLRVELVAWFPRATETDSCLNDFVQFHPRRALFQRAETIYFPTTRTFPSPADLSPPGVISAIIDDYRRGTISSPTERYHFAIQELQGADEGRWEETSISTFHEEHIYLILKRTGIWTYVHFLIAQHFILGLPPAVPTTAEDDVVYNTADYYSSVSGSEHWAEEIFGPKPGKKPKHDPEDDYYETYAETDYYQDIDPTLGSSSSP